MKDWKIKMQARKWTMGALALVMVAAGWISTWEKEPVSAVIASTRVPLEENVQKAQEEAQRAQEEITRAPEAAETPMPPEAQTGFSEYRQDVEQTRQTSARLLDEVISDERVQEETAQRALEEKIDLARRREMEKNVETILKIRGFEESLCVLSASGASIVVERAQLSQKEAAQILDVAMEQTGLAAENIRIIPTL